MRTSLLSFTLFVCTLASAQEGTINVVTEDTVTVGHVFDATWAMDIMPEETELPVFRELEVVSGPNKSSNMSIINGVTMVSTKYIYKVKALTEGVHPLPVFRVKKKDQRRWIVSAEREVVARGDGARQERAFRQHTALP